jgi:aerobic-type carbon monoxide dehydrogenase small subunit (CoxS/CutS family)
VLEHNPDAGIETIREHLGGNLCRCGSYPQILEAISALIEARVQQ